jgi:hypothetical protein
LPSPSSRVVEEREARTGEERELMEDPAAEVSMPDPGSTDLLTNFLPFSRASLEEAIDHFLNRFEDLSSDVTTWSAPPVLLPAVTVVAAAALASEVVRRRSRNDEAETEDSADDLARYLGYPNARSYGEA